MKRLRLSNDLFVASFMITFTATALSGLLAASQFYYSRQARNPLWRQTDVSGELRVLEIAGGLCAAVLALRLFAPVTWVDLRSERAPDRPAWVDAAPALPNSEVQPELTPEQQEHAIWAEAEDTGLSALLRRYAVLIVLALLLPLKFGMRFTEHGMSFWRWELGFFHLLGRDWTGAELLTIALLLAVLAAVCVSGWRGERDLNR